MNKLLQSLFIFMCFTVSVYAQDRTVTGTVTSSEDGLPIPSVSVKVKEVPKLSVTTDASGKFTIRVPSAGKTLIFSSVSFMSQEVAITGNVVNAILAVDTKVLTEVVIAGAYGTKQPLEQQLLTFKM